MKGRRLQIWVGRFASRSRFAGFLKETYEDDDPISEFARSQATEFYDHDFLETRFLPKATADVAALLAGLTDSASFEAAVAARRTLREPSNAVLILSDEDEIETARSASGPGYVLEYLGSFPYDPSESAKAPSAAARVVEVALHVVKNGPVAWRGRPAKSVTVPADGLIIGRGPAPAESNYLDLAPGASSTAVRSRQVAIYRDQFEQWVIEDLEANDQTFVGTTPLNGERSLPWDGIVFSVGGVSFRWQCKS